MKKVVFPLFIVCLLTIYACLSMKKETFIPPVTNTKEAIALFPISASQIKEWSTQAQADASKRINAIIQLDNNARTFANTADALDQLLEQFSIRMLAIDTVLYVYPDQNMRDAAKQEIVALQGFIIDNISNNVDLYHAFDSYAQTNAPKENLNAEQQYFITETLKDFKRSGLNLPKETRDQVAQVKKELAKLSNDFDININTDKSSITATREQLDGVDEDFIATLKQDDTGNYQLFCDYPTIGAVMPHCKIEDTRKRLYRAFNNRAYPQNIALLEQVIALRDQLAHLLGYESYAAYDIDNQMAKTPERVQTFLNQLVEKAHKKTEEEFGQWLADMPDGITLNEQKQIEPWNLGYAKEQYKQKHLKIDDRVVAQYFPMEKTVKELLDIYQQFFSLTFTQVPATGAWHPDVQLIEVRSATNDHKELVGYLFLDLHPRPDKYSHAAQETVVSVTRNADGTIKTPAVALVMANFPKSTATKPSLLKHNDVTTFFHEFGHAIHALLGATQLASFSGTSVKTDFVEMPSQMLENWMYEPEILRKVSGHYKTGQPLPDDIIKTLQNIQTFDSGTFLTRQCFLSQAALDFYKPGATKDTTPMFHKLYIKMNPHVALDPKYHMHASWGHLTGYGAKYYGYMWARVFAADMFEEIKKHGLLNPEIGKKYKDLILAKGGSIEPDQLLRDFLGREPNTQAFFKQLDLI